MWIIQTVVAAFIWIMQHSMLLVGAGASAGLVGANPEPAPVTGEQECTPELAAEKATEFQVMVAEIANSDPARMQELGPKMQEIATKFAAAGDDFSVTCKAYDELIAELNK
jgi:hypothetical protein